MWPMRSWLQEYFSPYTCTHLRPVTSHLESSVYHVIVLFVCSKELCWNFAKDPDQSAFTWTLILKVKTFQAIFQSIIFYAFSIKMKSPSRGSKSVHYMMTLIFCQLQQWKHHLFFGVNLRSGGGEGDKKERRTAWAQSISLLIWAREIKEYSQTIVNGLFRKLVQ